MLKCIEILYVQEYLLEWLYVQEYLLFVRVKQNVSLNIHQKGD